MVKYIAVAVKGCKEKKIKTWEQVGEYQRRGWNIVLLLNGGKQERSKK